MKTFAKVLSLALIALPFSAGAASVYSDTSVGVNVGTKASTSVDVSAGASGSAGSGSQGSTGNTVVDVNVDASGNQNGTSGDASMSSEFKLFTDGVKANNSNVEAVAVKQDGSVDVAYHHNGRFLGFIPMKVTSHTIVKSDANGNVTVSVKMPWWSFLVGGVSKVKSDIEASLQTNAEIKAEAAVSASDEARAKIVNAVVSSLNAEASASAEASTKASAIAN